jgi:hypothetical protein
MDIVRSMVVVRQGDQSRKGNFWTVHLKGGRRIGMLMECRGERWGYRLHGFDSKPHKGFASRGEALARLLLKLNGK